MKRRRLKYIFFMLGAFIVPSLLSLGASLATPNFNHFVVASAASHVKDGEEKLLVRLDNKVDIVEDWKTFATTYNRRHKTYSSLFRLYNDVTIATAASEQVVKIADISLRSSNETDVIEGLKIIDIGHTFQDLLTVENSVVISDVYARKLMAEQGKTEMAELLNTEVNLVRGDVSLPHKVRAIYDVSVNGEFVNNKYYETLGDVFFINRKDEPLFANPEYYLTLGRDSNINTIIYEDLQYFNSKWPIEIAKTSLDPNTQTLINKYDELNKSAGFITLIIGFIVIGVIMSVLALVVIIVKIKGGKKDWQLKKFDKPSIIMLVILALPLLLITFTNKLPISGLAINRLTPWGIIVYALSAIIIYGAFKALFTSEEKLGVVNEEEEG